MRKLLLGLILILPLLSFSQYQGFRFGARLAYGTATYSSASWDQVGKSGTLVEGAIVMNYGFEDWFGIRSEVQYSFSNGGGTGMKRVVSPNAKFERFDDTYTNQGIAIPILLHFSFPLRRIRPYADGGLYSQFNLNTTEERVYQNESLNATYNIPQGTMASTNALSFTMMMNFGIEVPYGSRFSYFVEAKWQPYMTAIAKSDQKQLTMKGIAISAGFLF